MSSIRVMVLSGLLIFCVTAQAAIETQEKDKVQFAGMMGRMMNFFGGKAMREGVTETVAVKGNRKRTMGDTTGQIIDLDEEKVYDLDLKGHTYRVTTFEQLRRRMQDAEEKAKKEAPPEQKPAETSGQPQKQMQVDFDLKESGQKKNINGYDCREVVMTVAVHEKGKTLDQAGGMVLTSHEWLAPRIDAMKEIADFDRRYSEKLSGPVVLSGADAEQMAAAMAMYPNMKDALGKFQVENVNMDGTPIEITMTMEGVKSAEEMAQQQKTQEQNSNSTTDITSVRGILGGLGKKIAKKKTEQDQNATSNRATIMTMDHELLKVSPDVAEADLAIPGGFKEKK